MQALAALALTTLSLAPLALAQTAPCLAEFDQNNRVLSGILTCTRQPRQFAYRTTVPRVAIVRAMRIFTGSRNVSGTMALEIYSDGPNQPGNSLARGTWHVTRQAPNRFQGANFNKTLVLVPGRNYWFVWTMVCGAVQPHEGAGAGGKVFRSRLVGGRWIPGNNTPRLKYRLYCNLLDEPGVTTVGDGCGTDTATFFTNRPATVGNAFFKLQGTNLPAGARVLFFVGANPNFRSIDLRAAGGLGCFLHSDILVQVPGTSGTAPPGTGALGRGHVFFATPIPNNPALKGAFVRGQLAAADAASQNALKAVFSNGLKITVQ